MRDELKEASAREARLKRALGETYYDSSGLQDETDSLRCFVGEGC